MEGAAVLNLFGSRAFCWISSCGGVVLQIDKFLHEVFFVASKPRSRATVQQPLPHMLALMVARADGDQSSRKHETNIEHPTVCALLP